MPLSTQTRLGLLVIAVAVALLGAGIGYDAMREGPVTLGLTDILMALFGGIVAVGLYHGWTMDVEDANPAETE
jgi:hypothetical protein